MSRRTLLRSLLTSTIGLGLLGCTTAHADASPPPRIAQPIAVGEPAPSSPYTVEVLGDNGLTLETYQHRGRFYVLGDAGERYLIRVTNPTARRVEAVVSIDGLDSIDGATADLGKRGYVVPAYGELRVEGFRTSTQEVATFRFSSVNNSYAGRKGKARNVGVIGVAIFEEQAPPEVIVRDRVYLDDAPPPPVRGGYRRYDGDADAGGGSGYAGGAAPARESAKAPSVGSESVEGRGEARADLRPADPAPTTSAPTGGAPMPPSDRYVEQRPTSRTSCDGCTAKKSRPGLGTEYGEQRSSAVSWTRFVRAASRPQAYVELRYNDAAGLLALGIPVQVGPDEDELGTRETADPFPGQRFSQPPGY